MKKNLNSCVALWRNWLEFEIWSDSYKFNSCAKPLFLALPNALCMEVYAYREENKIGIGRRAFGAGLDN